MKQSPEDLMVVENWLREQSRQCELDMDAIQSRMDQLEEEIKRVAAVRAAKLQNRKRP